MPHKPSKPSTASVSFVSVSLTKELQDQLKEWAQNNNDDLAEHIADAATSGYRVTVKPEDTGYSASMAAVTAQSPNVGMVLMERGSTPQRALIRLLWAHTAHFERVWPRSRDVEGDDW